MPRLKAVGGTSKTRKFDGKTYKYIGSIEYKSMAKSIVEKERKRGKNARVIKTTHTFRGKRIYDVYVRGSR